MAKETNEETPEEKELRKENERWKDYASALLIAVPILLAGLAISGQKTWASIISGIAGTVAIVLVVLWYARDSNFRQFTPRDKYPTTLYYASWFFGIQVAFLFFSLLIIA